MLAGETTEAAARRSTILVAVATRVFDHGMGMPNGFAPPARSVQVAYCDSGEHRAFSDPLGAGACGSI